MHYIELCTENCRFCRFLVLMQSLGKSLGNVRSSVFLKSYGADSETEEGVLIYPSATLFGH